MTEKELAAFKVIADMAARIDSEPKSQEHEFVIKGERIMARDKKTAIKIYANRHPEAKGKKHKNK